MKDIIDALIAAVAAWFDTTANGDNLGVGEFLYSLYNTIVQAFATAVA